MGHFLFPDNNPPMLVNRASVDQACIWLLSVMDEGDPSKRFVASLLMYFYERGYLSEKQMAALRSLCSKTIRRHLDGDLLCQGALPSCAQELEFGTVVKIGRPGKDDAEVIE